MSRRYQTTPCEVLKLDDDTLTIENLRDRVETTVRLQEVRVVRLTLEEGRGTCALGMASGITHKIRSFQHNGARVRHNDAASYRRFVVELHRGLAQHAPSAGLTAGRRRTWLFGRALIGLSAFGVVASVVGGWVLGVTNTFVVLGPVAVSAILGIHGSTLIQQRPLTYSALAVPESHLPHDES